MNSEKNIISSTLKKGFIFKEASNESLEILNRESELVKLSKDEVLFREGEKGENVYVLVSGRVAFLMHDENDKRYTLGLIADHSIFGDMEVFSGSLRVSHVEALSDSTIISFPKNVFVDVVKGDAGIAFNIIKFYAALLERLTRFSLFRDVEKQLAYILVDLASRYGKPVRFNLELARPSEGVEIDVPLSQEFLSTFVGIPRQRVNVILKSWEAKGWIQVNYNRLVILDSAALKKYSII
jgi:CRP-like cAMP-binding protein